MDINIDYEEALDFTHCDNITQARNRLSEITNLLNKVIAVRHKSKSDILDECSRYPEERLHKLSWDNKIVALKIATSRSDRILELISLYDKADEVYSKLRNKQKQVLEDLLALKKIADITPN